MAGKVTAENLEKVFTYQKATPDQEKAYAAIREAGIAFAKVLLDYVPDCADRSTAMRTLRETRMWANAAVALEGEV
jgi:hypothetical protein